MKYQKFHDLESYLLEEVRHRWKSSGRISPFDFWCILTWKANRAKNRTKLRLKQCARGDFAKAVRLISKDLRNAKTPETRLQVLMKDWGFRLPIASAVLTILYPKEFTVYDKRVCGELKRFSELLQRRFSTKLWADYLKYKKAVEKATPPGLSLREKDRYLWGRSFYKDAKVQCV